MAALSGKCLQRLHRLATDSKSLLMATRCTLNAIGFPDDGVTPGTCLSAGTPLTWQVALQSCENLFYEGYDDWRLPNLKELLQLVDFSLASPSIDSSVFPSSAVNYDWSSTTNTANTGAALAIDLSDSTIYSTAKNTSHHTRCVRGP